MCATHAVAAVNLLTRLHTFGIGLSRTVRLCEAEALCPRVRLERAVRAGQIIAVLPDTTLWTVNSFLAEGDDACGLAPAPEELAEVVLSYSAAHGDDGAAGPALDECYIAHCLALRCFTKVDCWFSARIRRHCMSVSAATQNETTLAKTWDTPSDVALLRRIAETMVSVPTPIALAALRYVRAYGLRRCPEKGGRPGLCVAPFLDLLVGGVAVEGGANVRLQCSTAQEVREALSSNGLIGARQRLRGKEDACRYWLLRVASDVPAGTTLLLSRDFGAPS